MLLRNPPANGWDDVELLPVGLCDRFGILKLFGGGMATSFVPSCAVAEDDAFRLVPVTTLENVIATRFSGKRLLVLIDVEGYEWPALKGCPRQLDREPSPRWFVEICLYEP